MTSILSILNPLSWGAPLLLAIGFILGVGSADFKKNLPVVGVSPATFHNIVRQKMDYAGQYLRELKQARF